jgi:hypothetical protein
MATERQISKTRGLVDSYVNCFRMAKGRKPEEIALTPAQAAHLEVKQGEQYQGMAVRVVK